MSRRRGLTPEEIIAELQNIDECDSEGPSEDEQSDDQCSAQDPSESCSPVDTESSSEESDDTSVPPPAKRTARGGNLPQASSKANPRKQKVASSSTNSPPAVGSVVTSPDGSKWTVILPGAANPGKRAQMNVFRDKEGPSPHARRYVELGSPTSSWRLIITEKILKHIQKCTETEARRHLAEKQKNGGHDKQNWTVSLEEIEAVLGIMYIRGANEMRSIPFKSLWSKNYGLPIVMETMSRNRASEILRYLRFDLKNSRSERLKRDKFALMSEVWNPFIDNCQSAYVPGPYLCVDEQLFPSKARCPFTQYIPSKPDKYGQKFWMLVDKDSKYILNAFPYLGKDEQRPGYTRLSDYVVQKLSCPYLKKGRNITCDNFFSSTNLAKELQSKSTSLVGTINKIRRKVPQAGKSPKLARGDTLLLKNGNMTLTVYQDKKPPKKHVIVLSTLHPDVSISAGPKKKPETVVCYNHTKYGVDVVDAMARKYSVKAGSRRWPLHTFYNLLDLAGINSWILYRKCTTSRVSRRDYLRELGEELTKPLRPTTSSNVDPVEDDAPEPETTRRRCQVHKQCRPGAKSANKCAKCKKVTCKQCVAKTCYICVNCV